MECLKCGAEGIIMITCAKVWGNTVFPKLLPIWLQFDGFQIAGCELIHVIWHSDRIVRMLFLTTAMKTRG